MGKTLLDNIFSTLFVYGVMISISLIPFNNIDFLNPIEQLLADFEFSDLAFSHKKDIEEKHKYDPNIVLINLPPAYLGRNAIAEELEVLKEFNPKVIGIDAFFWDKKTETPMENFADIRLAATLQSLPQVVLVSKLHHSPENDSFDNLTHSDSLFITNKHIGFANMYLHSGGESEMDFRVVRETRLTEDVNKELIPSYAYKIASLYNGKVEVKSSEPYTINFKGNIYGVGRSFSTLDYEQLINKQFDPELIKDKIVLLGYLGDGEVELTPKTFSEDKFFTPLNPNYVGKSYPDMFGVVVHANIISMLLDQSFITTLSPITEHIIGIIIVFLNICLFSFVYRKYDRWYDAVTKAWQLLFLLFISYCIVLAMYDFNLKLELTSGMIGVALAADLMEVYQSGIKNIYRQLISKFKKT